MFDSELLFEKSRHRILRRIFDLQAGKFIHDAKWVPSVAAMTARHAGTELSVIGELPTEIWPQPEAMFDCLNSQLPEPEAWSIA